MKSLALGLVLAAGMAHAGCGPLPEACELPEGTYHIALPEGVTGPVPAVLMVHGHGGEGQGMVRANGLAGQLLERGYAVIGPDGQTRERGGRSWDFHPNRPARRDETAFLLAVAEDATARFGLARDRILLAGFSIGGSLTSYVACAQPGAFAAYAPLAGSFWRPHPVGCAGPVSLLHVHGKADGTVPLLGRQIRPEFAQGNVFEAMQIWRETNGCPSATPEATDRLGIYTIERWTRCSSGARLDFALHEGGHSIPRGWAGLVIDWFEALP